ncbi:zf-HC2 domain-containing protein [Actinomadura viridis]|uniref:zf-HC2 domain-containing protein n=1 Tax=Actinomadura viridis TaxID=58110 RepID=UPI0036B2B020
MNGCAEARASLGVYVLGAIDPAERARLEAHVEGCPACRDELAGLAGMPALLGRVNETQIAQVTGPPPELLDALLAQAAEGRRGWRGRLAGALPGTLPGRGPARGPGPGAGRRRWLPAAAAACALLLAGALAGGAVVSLTGDRSPAAPAPTAPPLVSTGPGGERLVAGAPGGRVKAEVVLYSRKWGTKVELRLEGATYGERCRWYAVARDGRRDPLGSWYVAYKKGVGVYESSTMIPRDQLYSFEVVTVEGRPLVTVPA